MIVRFKVDNLINMNDSLKEFSEFLRRQAIPDDEIFASRLVSCELITNVIRHSGESANFCGELLPDIISITVRGESPAHFDVLTGLPDVFAESGRGLYIVRCFGEIEEDDGGLRVNIVRRRD